MTRNGWLVEKSHGSRFQAGWPDLLAMHVEHGQRWIEVKRPKAGRLTRAQRKNFARWTAHGARIWILDDEKGLESVLSGEPNWETWRK